MFTRIKKALQGAHSHATSLSITSDSLTYFLLGLLVVVGPLFFLPIKGLAVSTSKGFFVMIIGILGLLAYGIQSLRTGSLSLPRGRMFQAFGIVAVIGLIGSVLSGAFGVSLVGYGFETTTWLFVAVFGLLMLFSYRSLRSYERIGMLYGGLLVSFLIIFLLQVVRYIAGPTAISLNVLWSSTATLVGSWGDLGIFFGGIVLLSMVTLELAGLKQQARTILIVIGGLALAFLAFMNIQTVWIVLGLLSLIFTLYIFSFAYWDHDTKAYRKESRVPWFALALFIVSVVCIFFGGLLNSLANKHQNISFSDVRPSFSTTVKVSQKSLGHNFATGFGPNMFAPAWSLAKPPVLSGTDAGNTDFSLGYGYVPSHIATEGILGGIAWIGFFVLLLMALYRKIARGFDHSLDRFIALSLGVLILYLGIMAWIYVPGAYLLALLAVLIGAFLATSIPKDGTGDLSVSFIQDPRTSFFGILGVTVLILGTLFVGYVEARKLVSFGHYAHGMVLLSSGKYQDANREVSVAAALASHDLYHQQLARFAMSDATQLVGTTTAANKDAVSKQAEQVIGVALGNAQAAVTLNPLSYKNWVLLGDVYRFMVTLGINDASAKALDAYQQAAKRNPNDATMKLSLAELDITNKDFDGAYSAIADSINQYPTRDAYVLRAQIQLGQQKYDLALASMKAALGVDPYNVDLNYQYGLLLFTQKDYANAITAFQRVILLNRNFGPAYVYLGVSYERSGDMDNANKVYDYIRKQSPDADTVINKVRNGDVQAPSADVPAAGTAADSGAASGTTPVVLPAAPVAPKAPVKKAAVPTKKAVAPVVKKQ